jgi:hypothetical protein
MMLVAPTTRVVDHGRGQTLNSRQEFRGWLAAFGTMSSNIKIVDALLRERRLGDGAVPGGRDPRRADDGVSGE